MVRRSRVTQGNVRCLATLRRSVATPALTQRFCEASLTRNAFTLLEVMLAAAIGVLLIIALYAAISTQIQQAQAGRDLIEEGVLVRSILNRMSSDILATASLCDPARYRNQNNQGNSGATASSSTTSTTSTSSTATTGASSSSSSSTSTTNSTSSTSSSTDSSATGGSGPVKLPLGVRGDSLSLTLFVSKVPADAYPTRSGDPGQLTSDIRRITYWVAADPAGLARQEIKVVTSEDVATDTSPIGGPDEAQLIFAPEVRSIELQYFDGTTWQDSWDSTTLGADGITPLGPPRAVAIRMGLMRVGKNGNNPDDLKYIRHVAAIPTANGTTQQQTTGGTTP